MDYRNNLSITSGGLTELSCQDDTAESRLYHRGISVQTLNSPCTTYCSQSNANENNTQLFNPLNESDVTPLLQAVPVNFDKVDLTFTGSILDEYKPWNPDKESVYSELFPMLDSHLHYDSCFATIGPDTKIPIPANRIDHDNHLTDFPTEPDYQHDSRPVAAVKPPNLQQATSDDPVNSPEIVADKSLQTECQVKHHKILTFAERERVRLRVRQRERRKNPDYVKRQKERERERKRERLKDPAYAERSRERNRERDRKCRREDPITAESRRLWVKTYNRLKKISGREEASKLASVAKQEYLQSVNSSKD